MTLPSSGPLTRSQIESEFGLASSAIWPDNFFGLGGAPAARPLKFSDFHGRSAFTSATNWGSSPGLGDEPPGSYSEGDPGQFHIYSAVSGITWAYVVTGTNAGNVTISQTTNSFYAHFGTNSTFTVWSANVTIHATYNGVTYGPWSVDLVNQGLN